METVLTTAMVVLGGIAVLVLIAITARRSLASKPMAPTAIPAKVSDGKTGTQASGWANFQSRWAMPVSIKPILLAWFVTSPESFKTAATTPVFWAGFILVVVVFGILLSTSKEFEKRWDRRFLMAVSLLGGTILIIYSVTPPGTAAAVMSVFAPQSATTKKSQQVVVQVWPDRDSQEIATNPAAHIHFDSPGRWLEFIFPNGEKIRIAEGGTITHTGSNGTQKRLAVFPQILPQTSLQFRDGRRRAIFRLRGDGGVATITLS